MSTDDLHTDSVVTFKSLGLDDQLCKACEIQKWSAPSEIQIKAIPVALQGKDIIGLAETGSGKTGAFALPILHDLLQGPRKWFALVLTPTRELAFQISDQFRALGSLIKVKCAVIVGGIDIVAQQIDLEKSPHIIIATPGRLLDILKQTKSFHLKFIKYLVMDEADRILNEDFQDEVKSIIEFIKQEHRTFLFSATMTKKVEKLKRAHLKDPVLVEVSSNYQTVANLIQSFLFIPAKDKEVYLTYLLNDLQGNSCIVFCETVKSTQLIALMLRSLGFSALALHSQMSQMKRLASLNKFKNKSKSILVATDVASRGLDIVHVDVVINLDAPSRPKDYIHRVGRTARAGRSGKAYTLVTQYDIDLLLKIEELLGKKIDKLELPHDEVMQLKQRVSDALILAKTKMNEESKQKGGKRKRGQDSDDEAEGSSGYSKPLKKKNVKRR